MCRGSWQVRQVLVGLILRRRRKRVLDPAAIVTLDPSVDAMGFSVTGIQAVPTTCSLCSSRKQGLVFAHPAPTLARFMVRFSWDG